MNKQIAKKTRQICFIMAVVAFFIIELLVYAPLEAVVLAEGSMLFSVSEIASIFLPVALIAFFALTLIAAVLPRSLRKIVLSILFSLSLCFYLQVNFLNQDYGILDGTPIEWAQYGSYGTFNNIIWIAIVLLPIVAVFWKEKISCKAMQYVSLFFASFQTLTLVLLLVSHPTTSNDEITGLSSEGLYTVGSQDNTIVLIVDSFDTMYMDYLVEQEPQHLEGLDGFTYYQNNVGKFPKTSAAVPHILSGSAYTNDVPRSTYVAKAYAESPLLQGFADAGYDVRVFTTVDKKEIAQYVQNKATVAYEPTSFVDLGLFIGKYVLFRGVPHDLKQNFWLATSDVNKVVNRTGEESPFTKDNVAFYQPLIANGLDSTLYKKALRVIHIDGTHEPFKMLASVEYATDGSSNLFEQLRGTMSILHAYLNELRKNGVYDNSTILIVGDHGGAQINQPALLLKRPGESHPLSISDTPVSNDDIIPTLLDSANLPLDKVKTGMPVYSIPEGLTRERIRYDYTIDTKAEKGYMPVMWEQKYNDDYSTPHYTGRVCIAGEPEDAKAVAEVLTYNTPILAKKLDMYFSPAAISWGTKEYIWLTGKQAVLHFKVPHVPVEGVRLRLEWTNWVTTEQKIVLKYRETLLGEAKHKRGDGIESIEVTIPAECFDSDGYVRLYVELPEATSTVLQGSGTDARLNSFGLKSLTIWEK